MVERWISPFSWVAYWLMGGVSPREAVERAKRAAESAGLPSQAPIMVEGGWVTYHVTTNILCIDAQTYVRVRRRDGEVLRCFLPGRRSGVCLKCSYDVTGNESGVCPECGSKIGRK